MRPSRLRRVLGDFARREDGGVLVESILWLPLFLSLFVMIADSSTMFLNQARIKKIMQDGARDMAVGDLPECADLVDFLQTHVRKIAPSATATCDENYMNQPTLSIARVQANSDELDLTGASGFFGGITVGLSMVYHLEVG